MVGVRRAHQPVHSPEKLKFGQLSVSQFHEQDVDFIDEFYGILVTSVQDRL